MSDHLLTKILEELGMHKFIPLMGDLGVDLTVFSKITIVYSGSLPHLRMSTSMSKLLFTDCGLNQSQLIQIMNLIKQKGIKPELLSSRVQSPINAKALQHYTQNAVVKGTTKRI